MSSREFLNVAHAALVEELMRARTTRGVTIAGMQLDEALEYAAQWAEGYVEPKIPVPPAGTAVAPTARQMVQQHREKSEEEIVAQNERAMQVLMGQIQNMKGGFSTRPKQT